MVRARQKEIDSILNEIYIYIARNISIYDILLYLPYIIIYLSIKPQLHANLYNIIIFYEEFF